MFGWLKRSDRGERSERAQKNDKLRAALADYGDDGSEPREVVHFAYPSPDGAGADRNELMIDLAYLGMEFLDSDPTRPSAILREVREVASTEFDRHTEELEAVFLGKSWQYDGWESAVLTEGQEGKYT
ncbi:MAG: hypothetical protein AAFQ66_19370 [Pseudomonadota bacterium]